MRLETEYGSLNIEVHTENKVDVHGNLLVRGINYRVSVLFENKQVKETYIFRDDNGGYASKLITQLIVAEVETKLLEWIEKYPHIIFHAGIESRKYAIHRKENEELNQKKQLEKIQDEIKQLKEEFAKYLLTSTNV